MLFHQIFSKKFRLKKTELCPCGSGLIYRDCCLGKEDAPRDIVKPPQVQLMEQIRASLPKCCMHPDRSSCKGKIKEAHALQNKKILSILADKDHHVYMLAMKGHPLIVPLSEQEIATIIEIKKVGVNKATTETCFCDYHDSTVFAPIEKGSPDFDGGDKMKFLYAYKTFIFEYYKHDSAVQMFRAFFKRMPQTMSQKQIVNYYRMLQMKSEELNPIKDFFDTHLLQRDFSGLCTCVVAVPYQIKFATYSFVALDYDLNGKKIQNTDRGIMHRLSVTVFPEETQSWIMMSCLESEQKYYDAFFKQMRSESVEKIAFYFSCILPLYSENIVISPSLWESWDEKTQMAYTYYANLTGKEFLTMRMCAKFMLQNAAKARSEDVNKHPPRINLFA